MPTADETQSDVYDEPALQAMTHRGMGGGGNGRG